MRTKNGIPIGSDDEIVPTNGGTHAIWAVFHALFEPGDEMIVLRSRNGRRRWRSPVAAKATPVAVPLHESLGWRWDLDELERAITPRTRAIYVNSPNNPTGGVLTRADLERIADIARERDLWVLSDEAYEDVLFRGEHVSIASLPGMYERTIPLYTFSKSYAMTGLRLGYFAHPDKVLRAAPSRSSRTRRATSTRSCSTAASARSRGHRTASRSIATSCRRGAICSTPAWPTRRRESSAAIRPTARSTRS